VSVVTFPEFVESRQTFLPTQRTTACTAQITSFQDLVVIPSVAIVPILIFV
jgi:hypothetical protein